MTNQGFGNKEIALKAGCPEWAVRKYQSQIRAFSMDQLKQAIRDGVEYETAVKTGHMNDQMSMICVWYCNLKRGISALCLVEISPQMWKSS